MKIYKKIEFSQEDYNSVINMQLLAYYIEQYRLTDELGLCDFISFTGNLEKLRAYIVN